MPETREVSVETSDFPQPDETHRSALSLTEVAPLIEALLFVADEPTSIERLAATLLVDEELVVTALEELGRQCETRGLRVQRKGQRVQLVTAPHAAEVIERFLGLDLSGKLSPATLEALAIVAYKQPVTRADVDAIRGVQSDYVMRSLVSKGLIEEIGRLEQAGRPIIYGTTFEFLQHFGLTDLSELPPLEPDEFDIPALPQAGKATES
jgi:segregation and condensation protein B